MKLTENEFFEKYAEQCRHCMMNTLLPKEYEWNCFCFGYTFLERKNEPTKINEK